MARRLIYTMVIFIVLALLYISYAHLQITKHKSSTPPNDADYLIILGAKVRGDVPSLSLQNRIDAAYEYLMSNPSTKAIVSGGQGAGEDISEAMAMKNALVSLGIDETRIIMEDRSTTTYENIKFSKELIANKKSDIIVVSNDFHLSRSIKIGEKYGLNLEGLPAKTPKQVIVQSYIREYLALGKYYLLSLTNNIH